jgi:hypothetical protein
LHIFYIESPHIDSYADIDHKNWYQHYRFTRALPSIFNQHFNDTSFASYCIKCANVLDWCNYWWSIEMHLIIDNGSQGLLFVQEKYLWC